MPTIDSLDVKVQAYSSSAIASLDNLEKKLLATSRALRTMNGNSLQSFANGVMTLGQAVNQVKSIDSRSFTTLARNIERLGSVNASGLGSVAGSLRNMSTAISTLSGMQGNIQGISELAGAIRRLGYKSVETAISNMPRLAVSMQQLMASLSKAPTVNRNLIDMTNALANLTNSGYRFSNSTRSMNSGFSNIVSGSNRAQKSMKSFAYYFGKFYANYFLLFRAFGKIKGAMDIASSLTETQNVVNMTFGQMADRVDQFAKSSIKNFGMSELSAKQFSSRFQAMGSAMNIPMQGIGKNFDFINTKMNGMSDSVKRLYSNTDGLSDMSLNLTKLAGDMASFYNVEQSVVAEDLESIFTGQTRNLRKFGLDLTQATLQEWAMKNGIDANIKSMTQAEKTMLRYQYVMANADKSMGDFAKTSGRMCAA